MLLIWQRILIRLMRLTKLMNLTRLKVLIDQIIFIKLMIFVKLMNSWNELFWTVFFLKMLMKQIIKCKTLLTRLTNFYLQNKNINMISKIIFKIRFRLFWLFLIRTEILIILNLIWINIINIFIIKFEIFHNMIWLNKVK